ncbi:MAG: redoxin family protein [Clostridia bacterium]|nr:redoxin family protein [Clostridia bacterium]MBQ5488280.1 redoxin family protein [Clostridia bacterium]
MKKTASVILAALLALFSFTSAFAAVHTEDLNNTIGMTISGVNATDVHGGTVTDEFFGNAVVTVINEWATWCGPCVSEMPHFQTVHEYYSETPEADVQILGSIYISSSCTPASALQFLDSNGYTWTNVIEDNALATIFNNSNSIPNTIIVDRHGVIRDAHVGSFSNAAQLQNLIESWYNALLEEEGPIEPGPVDGPIPGDVDGDEQVTVSDALLIMRAAMSLAELGEDVIADVNDDGTVDISDALMVMRVALGLN